MNEFILAPQNHEYFIVCPLLWSIIYHLITFIKYISAWLIAPVLIYFYVICEYSHTHEDGGMLGYPNQDSICDITLRKYQNRYLERFPIYECTDNRIKEKYVCTIFAVLISLYVNLRLNGFHKLTVFTIIVFMNTQENML